MIKVNEIITSAYPCKACKRKQITSYPIITRVTDLYYAKCSCNECKRYDPYEFLGSTVKGALESWNIAMTHNEGDTTPKKYREHE